VIPHGAMRHAPKGSHVQGFDLSFFFFFFFSINMMIVSVLDRGVWRGSNQKVGGWGLAWSGVEVRRDEGTRTLGWP
jgi:hypothetical protein